MTRPMTHEEAYAALEAAALDALSADEQRDVLAHVASCTECSAAFDELRDTAALIAYAAPQSALGAERRAAVRSRLLGRVAQDSERSLRHTLSSGEVPAALQSARQRPAPRRTPTTSLPSWFALAAGIVAMVGVGLLAATWRDRNALRTSLASAEALDTALTRQVDSLRAANATNQQLLSALTGPRVRVVELAASGPQRPAARMFWDQATSRWTLVAHHLPAPPTGRTYQLWLVTTADAKISAGTFAPGTAGDAVVRAEYPLAEDSLKAVAITEEPAGGVPQPTGPMVLVGAAATR